MSSPVDPIRRAAQVRRAARAHAAGRDEENREIEDVNLPAVYARTPAPSTEGAAAFNAHLLGQDGQKRGLRGGPETLGAARNVYNRTEWSGPADRRARKGGVTKTEI